MSKTNKDGQTRTRIPASVVVSKKKTEESSKRPSVDGKPSKTTKTAAVTNNKTGSVSKVSSIVQRTENSKAILKTTVVSSKSSEKVKQVKPTTSATKSNSIVNPTKPLTSKPVPNNNTKRVPLKATYVPQKIVAPLSEKNVMNTIHNVTISSPPAQRKDYLGEAITVDPSIPRERTKTRTLEPEEILLLNKKSEPNSGEPTVQEIKHSVAFEINFGESVQSLVRPPSLKSDQKLLPKEIFAKETPPSPALSEDYEDDFESYESDFESCSTINLESLEADPSEPSADEEEQSSSSVQQEMASRSNVKSGDERRLDSGNYELKTVMDKAHLDNVNEMDVQSEGQADSGFGYPTLLTSESSPTPNTTFTNTNLNLSSYKSKKYNQRCTDLMNKLTLDTMSYSLFELKPIAYEYFMKIYGHVNTKQNVTQTMDNLVHQDVQTDLRQMCSVWTQWPPSYLSENISKPNFQHDRNGCGMDNNALENQPSNLCPLEDSLCEMSKFGIEDGFHQKLSTKPIDYDRLSLFLQKSAFTISNILAIDESKRVEMKPSIVPASKGFFNVHFQNCNVLKSTQIYGLYANYSLSNLIYLLHRMKVKDKNATDKCFVSIWNLMDTAKPIHILCSWSMVSCLEVQEEMPDVVIAGMNDSSIAVWNLTESTHWHKSNDGDSIFVPSQVVTPALNGKTFLDIGTVVAIKSFAVSSDRIGQFGNYNPTQICSLHEFGILTIWTFLHTTNKWNFDTSLSMSENRIDHQSPWSAIKLIQSNSIDLQCIIMQSSNKKRPKSGFDKTRSYFESNLFSDAALRELQEINNEDGLPLMDVRDFRCTDLAIDSDGFCVATNKRYLIFGQKSMHPDSIRKTIIDETNFLYPTSLTSIYQLELLLVGLSDGSVKAVSCGKSSKLGGPQQIQPVSSKSMDRGNTVDFNVVKSCAIQSIIEDERSKLHKSVVSTDFDLGVSNSSQQSGPSDNFELPRKFACDHQILHGLSMNQHFIKSINHSRLQDCLFVHAGQCLRLFKLDKMEEININLKEYKCATISCGLNNTEYLLLATNSNEIEVHILIGK